MNDKTAELIEQLANKLGTTSQYLWSVLIREARIDATIGLIMTSIVLIASICLYKTHKKLSKKMTDLGSYTLYDKYDAYPIIMIIAAFIVCVFIVVSFLDIPSIVYGFFNPEYWALHDILSSLHN